MGRREEIRYASAEVRRFYSWRERFLLLPRSVRTLLLVLLLCATLPGLAAIGLHDSAVAPALGFLAQRPWLTGLLSLAGPFGALLALERPRSWSFGDYAGQLAERFRRVQADFDGALRRRLQEEVSRHGPWPSQ